ncbi:MAG: redoxin domain-containing protein [Planctomycetota bacterium]
MPNIGTKRFRAVRLSILALGFAAIAAGVSGPQVGDSAPEIDAKEFLNAGGPVTLEGLRGKIVVVEFWATWCPPCRASIPHLNALYERNKEKGVVVIGLSNEPAEKVKPFAAKIGMKYCVGIGSGTGKKYGVTGIPHAFVVDPAGKIAWRGHPMAGLDKAIDEALEKTPPAAVAAGPDKPAPEGKKPTGKEPPAKAAPVETGPEVGKMAPEIQASSWANTEPLTLKGLREKVVVVEFWATWCPPCRASIPHLKELYHKYKNEGVVVIGLSDEPADKVKPFLEELKMDYPVGIGSRTGEAYKVEGIPHAFVVGKDGRIVWQGHPMEDLEGGIRKALGTTAGGVPKEEPRKEDPKALEAERVLNMARAALKNGDAEAAKRYYDEVLTKYPGTPQALAAKRERPH